MEKCKREEAPEGSSMPPPKRVCFKAEQDVKLVDKCVIREESAREALDAESAEDRSDLDARYPKDEVEKIRRRKKILAAGVAALGYGVSDTDVDTVNSRSAAVAASEADPEVEKDETGVAFEPFNMRKEFQEGTFDEDGNYVWRAKLHEEVKDGWLDAIDAGDARTAFRTEDERRRVLSRMDAEPEAVAVDVPASLRALSELLQPGETPTAAIRRVKAEASQRHAKEAAAECSVGGGRGGERGAGSASEASASEASASARQERRREEDEEDEAFRRPAARRKRRRDGEASSGGAGNEPAKADEAVERGGAKPPAEAPSAGSGSDSAKPGGAPPTNAADERMETDDEKDDGEPARRARAPQRRQAKGTRGGKMDGEELRVFNAITDLCSSLMTIGRNVYFLRREDILKELDAERARATPGTDGAETPMEDASREASGMASGSRGAPTTYWQFRWLNNPTDTEIHGPYPAAMFQAWMQQGFISDETSMEVRQTSAANDPLDGVWLSWRQADFRSAEEAEEEEREREAEEEEREREEEADRARAEEAARSKKQRELDGEDDEGEGAEYEKRSRKDDRVMKMLEKSGAR
ncbi:hypothetical protein BESB_077890 [Besnoitia besnoiti]|uniref:GYF domain-containing protein n=1 Tax=Besnoitia besnoiti TaxID=94643 RepID=A0A2A9MDW3_BESBE|nr:hypothetical protein BESB_077890 [Besnoitia besnoiti]PFH33572.1 hypothetical protein BESB_077890 [Besnoitia besnoiti]